MADPKDDEPVPGADGRLLSLAAHLQEIIKEMKIREETDAATESTVTVLLNLLQEKTGELDKASEDIRKKVREEEKVLYRTNVDLMLTALKNETLDGHLKTTENSMNRAVDLEKEWQAKRDAVKDREEMQKQ